MVVRVILSEIFRLQDKVGLASWHYAGTGAALLKAKLECVAGRMLDMRRNRSVVEGVAFAEYNSARQRIANLRYEAFTDWLPMLHRSQLAFQVHMTNVFT